MQSRLTGGQSFRDRDGQRWWVKGPRPDNSGQFVIEAQMKGAYPRVAVYTMTEPEFREHARSAHLQRENGHGRGSRGGRGNGERR